jgi:hypothetical protein
VVAAHLLRPAGRRRKDDRLKLARRADEAGHVFDDAQDVQVDRKSKL